MSRLVQARAKPPKDRNERGAADFTDGETPPQPPPGEVLKEYGERIAKYVPAEVLAFYSAAIQLISTGDSEQRRLWLFGIIGLLAWLITPVWLGKFSNDPATKRPNQMMGLVAFLVWAYAYPAGYFVEREWYDAMIGGLLVLTFSLLSGLYIPRK